MRQVEPLQRACVQRFNPHFTRMRSEIAVRLSSHLEKKGFNPHFTRMRSEMKTGSGRVAPKPVFQSSFYEDAL